MWFPIFIYFFLLRVWSGFEFTIECLLVWFEFESDLDMVLSFHQFVIDLRKADEEDDLVVLRKDGRKMKKNWKKKKNSSMHSYMAATDAQKGQMFKVNGQNS